MSQGWCGKALATPPTGKWECPVCPRILSPSVFGLGGFGGTRADCWQVVCGMRCGDRALHLQALG
jgi:hypothetical protein